MPPLWETLKRFLVYLWPADAPALRLRVVIAMALVLLGKATTLVMPFAYKGVIDRMAPGLAPEAGLAIALVAAYAGARFGGVLFDNLRNVAFERVGQVATRRLAEPTRAPVACRSSGQRAQTQCCPARSTQSGG